MDFIAAFNLNCLTKKILLAIAVTYNYTLLSLALKWGLPLITIIFFSPEFL